MLDTFEILTTSGVVLWSRSYVPTSPAIIDSFITNVFIEEKAVSAGTKDNQPTADNPPYRYDQHTLKWTFVKELGIIFVAVYRSLLHLSWIDKLVDNLKTIFVDLYGDQLKKPNTTIVHCHKFDEYFDQQYQELESRGTTKSAQAPDRPFDYEEEAVSGNLGDEPPLPPGLKQRTKPHAAAAAAKDASPPADPISISTSRPSTPGGNNHLVVGKTGPMARMSRKARKMQHSHSAPASSGDEASSRKGRKAPKKGRRWDADGFADEEDDVQLDYSVTQNALTSDSEVEATGRSTAVEGVDSASWGTTTSKGQFVLKDLGDEVHSILKSAEAKNAASSATPRAGFVGSGLSTIGGLFRNVVGGKTLTKEDLDKAMKGMEEHLLKKNVAREAAIRLCEGVEKELLGVKTGSFESIDARIAKAMEASLTKMLTPTSSLDLLREIDAVTRPSATSMRKRRPYVMSIVGVNGVGKSTNLSKICFFLLQNKYKVLIAAGDTFRSGAVEQLKVHVRNLKELTEREGGRVEIFEKGYGGDAATVAKDAVREAANEGYDVVLIDTAGRRHNDQRLMSSLEKFAKFAQPDKILMVGEALVGTDSVAQARNFNSSFGPGRHLDGFIISKCDTVGDMVGTLVSIVHATNVPVLFVGVGQHYSDIRNFSVKWAVEKLLSSN
ncbi:SRP54-domain-containing protein [Nemania serpens]|nr:SRP54-domain-containing protein [Nemania serpens]